jgi:hypothetical protein
LDMYPNLPDLHGHQSPATKKTSQEYRGGGRGALLRSRFTSGKCAEKGWPWPIDRTKTLYILSPVGHRKPSSIELDLVQSVRVLIQSVVANGHASPGCSNSWKIKMRTKFFPHEAMAVQCSAGGSQYPRISGVTMGISWPTSKSSWPRIGYWLPKGLRKHMSKRQMAPKSNSRLSWDTRDTLLKRPYVLQDTTTATEPCSRFETACQESYMQIWLVVSTPLKNISQIGSLSQLLGKIKMFQTTNQKFLWVCLKIVHTHKMATKK